MNIDFWRRYANSWAAPEAELAARLGEHVAEGIAYRDPNTELVGREALCAYVTTFQNVAAGHRFEIREVHAHHGRSLAKWRQFDAAGALVTDGVSVATHDERGLLKEITAFIVPA